MIDRRLFMKIAAAGLCSLALMERKLLADDCVPPTEDLVDYFISQSTIPDCLSDQIFLGFHAVKFHAKARRLPLDFLFMNYGLLAGTRVDGIRSRLKLVKRKICGREDFDYEIVAGPLDGLYSAKSEQTLINNQQTIKRMASLPYGDRVNEIIKILVVSFRDVLFKEQQSEVLPKTFPVLRVDNTGICRDFALT
ncbi:MAG: hypothetical protein EOM37_01405 [Proteobacteria bacterium]|nr:hypothetical protein [Pseudomonadota bacterium]